MQSKPIAIFDTELYYSTNSVIKTAQVLILKELERSNRTCYPPKLRFYKQTLAVISDTHTAYGTNKVFRPHLLPFITQTVAIGIKRILIYIQIVVPKILYDFFPDTQTFLHEADKATHFIFCKFYVIFMIVYGHIR